ncbi:MAG TPA: phosphatase PAP2 family protein [Myxococcales bacterium]|nr:phosphatase PAP2 family protein [Myxococcales bacterium]
MIENLRGAAVRGAIAASVAAAPVFAVEQSLDNGWPASFRRIGPAEGAVLVGGFGLGVLLMEVVVNPPAVPRWSEPILFDASARDALRGSDSARSAAATGSDIGYIGLPTYAIAVEAGLVTWLGRGHGDAALQLALINGEALAINGFLTRVVQKSVGRARPDASPATTDNTSFFSGHTSTAFAMASGLCVQHARIEIYGNVADKIVCPAALAVAATTGLLRIVADRHWASDVIAGAVVGSAIGATVSLVHLQNPGAPVASLSVGAGGRGLVFGARF